MPPKKKTKLVQDPTGEKVHGDEWLALHNAEARNPSPYLTSALPLALQEHGHLLKAVRLFSQPLKIRCNNMVAEMLGGRFHKFPKHALYLPSCYHDWASKPLCHIMLTLLALADYRPHFSIQCDSCALPL
jgi:hypothetical protein